MKKLVLFKKHKVRRAVDASKSRDYKKHATTIGRLNNPLVKSKLLESNGGKHKRDLTPFQSKRTNKYISQNSLITTGYEVVIETVWDESENKIVWAKVKDIKLLDSALIGLSREEIISRATSIYNEILSTLDIEEMRTDLRDLIFLILTPIFFIFISYKPFICVFIDMC